MCLFFDFQLTWIIFLSSLWPHRHQSANTAALPCVLCTANSSPIPLFIYFLWPICLGCFWIGFSFLCECKGFVLFLIPFASAQIKQITSASSSNLLPHYQWSVKDVLVNFSLLAMQKKLWASSSSVGKWIPASDLLVCLIIVNPAAYIFYFNLSLHSLVIQVLQSPGTPFIKTIKN